MILISKKKCFSLSIERRVEYNYTKYGDSPVCLSEEVDLPNQKVLLQGFGQQPDETIGELLQLELKTLQNEECYNRFLNVSETDKFGRKGSTGKKNEISTSIKQSLYDGITDQVLCTVFTCDGKTPSLDAKAKCVSNFDLKADIWKYSTLIRFRNSTCLYRR